MERGKEYEQSNGTQPLGQESKETLPQSGRGMPREQWDRHVEYILSSIGWAIGCANIWRFPYLCMRNGGGAFLVPYFLSLFVLGIPLFFMEVAVAQYGSASAITMWKLSPLFKGVGWCTVIINISFAVYYSTLTSWILYYLYSSFHAVLPWTHCDNQWNTGNCLSRFEANLTNITNEIHAYNNQSEISLNVTNSSIRTVPPSEEYWHYNVLELSGSISSPDGVRWPLVLGHTIGWLTLALVLCKGIKSSGKVVYVTVALPYLFLTILLIRGCTLPGSLSGILFFVTPVWSKLAEPRIWAEAALQVFYSLGPGWGAMVNFAGHNGFHNNIQRDAAVISLVNCGTSFYGGFAIFSVIGYMAQKANVPVDKVITSGPGLAFIVYPEALGTLPLPQLWSVLFFLMLLSLMIDTQFGTVECIIGSLRDEFGSVVNTKRRQMILSGVVFSGLYLSGLIFCTRGGLYFFQVWDWYMAAFSVVLVACTEALVISWIYGLERFFGDISSMVGRPPNVVFKPLWAVIIPILLTILFVFNCITFTTPSYGDYVYPVWANVFGWCIGMVAFVPIPVCLAMKLAEAKGTVKQRLMMSIRPAADWDPSFRADGECKTQIQHTEGVDIQLL